jgi:hypothetical protein
MRRRGKPSQASKEAQEKRKLELQEEARLKAKEDRNLAKLKQRAEYEFLEMREEFKLITPERVLARIQRIATNPQSVLQIVSRLRLSWANTSSCSRTRWSTRARMVTPSSSASIWEMRTTKLNPKRSM